jgi:AcrR family transcriptional regulator
VYLSRHRVYITYTGRVPRLWNDTIAAHRHQVRDAILDATAALVAQHGLLAVTMSQIAERAGIGRATLYKYFPDVAAILTAWHQRQISDHLGRLVQVRDQASEPGERLRAVLEAFALITHETNGHHEDELAALMHRDQHVVAAQAHLREMVRDLIARAAEAGEVRDDVAPAELAAYCLHAVGAASALASKAAVRRLVDTIVKGLSR